MVTQVISGIVTALVVLTVDRLWRKHMPVPQPAQDVVAQLVAAQDAYDTKLKSAVAPVQAELDSLKVDMTDTVAAFKAQADTMTADAAAAPTA